MQTPSGAQLPDHLEQLLRFVRRQRRGRLVHDQDAGVRRQRAGDLHHLHLPDGEVADQLGGWQPRAHARQQRGRLLVHRRARQRRQRGHPFAAEEDVRRDVEVRRQHQLLVDERDAELLGRADAVDDVTGCPSIRISPAVRGLHAAQDLHERALAGAVLPHQRQHLARPRGQERRRATPSRRRSACRCPLIASKRRTDGGSDGAGLGRAHGDCVGYERFSSASLALKPATLLLSIKSTPVSMLCEGGIAAFAASPLVASSCIHLEAR